MRHLSYVNGQYTPRITSAVSIEDRGYQFGDGVYQVVAYVNGAFIDLIAHLDLLKYSLDAVGIPMPMSYESLCQVLKTLIHKNNCQNAHVYIQVTRGVEKRTHVPSDDLKPAIVITISEMQFPNYTHQGVPEIKVILQPDIRWKRPDIKSLSLLPNIMAKKAAEKEGAYDAWLLDDTGCITEGGACNAWIVNAKGQLQTHPPTQAILNGVTRQRIIQLAKSIGMEVVEKPFTKADLPGAKEAFITAAVSMIKAVTHVDNTQIGTGYVGENTQKLARAYGAFLRG